MRQRSGVLTGVTALFISVGVAVPAVAAVPNDAIANALTITAIPYAHTQGITSATAAASEPKDCQDGGTVWFRYKAKGVRDLAATAGSDDFAGLVAVYDGKPGARSTSVSCGQRAAYLTTQPGHTYFISVSGTFDAGARLSFHLLTVPRIQASVALQGSVRWVDGVATVGVIVACSRAMTRVEFDLTLVQQVTKKLVASGRGTQVVFACSSTPTRVPIKVEPGDGSGTVPFVKGPAQVTLDPGVYGCDRFGACAFVVSADPTVVRLT